jgi:hypothetical protein
VVRGYRFRCSYVKKLMERESLWLAWATAGGARCGGRGGV